jgi:hypothetical protein
MEELQIKLKRNIDKALDKCLETQKSDLQAKIQIEYLNALANLANSILK